MLRAIVHNRMMLSFSLASSVGYVLLKRWPFPGGRRCAAVDRPSEALVV